jgi:hypothetical protein
MVMLQVWILEGLTFQKAHHYAAYTTVFCFIGTRPWDSSRKEREN